MDHETGRGRDGAARPPCIDNDNALLAESTTAAEPIGISRRQLLAEAGALSAGLSVAPLFAEADPLVRARIPASPATDATQSGTLDIRLNINGTDHTVAIEPRVTLLDALRERLHLTGSKKGCDHGQCGACTVHVDGRRINSCLTLAIMHQGQKITTIEGLANGDTLHPMQTAFIEHDGFQCGYCTPGQIMSATALVAEGHARSEDEIREQMSGNICRCGAYPNIVAAVHSVIEGKRS
jgi:xanthine dehydrogenase YagT iron-sulfur-binding subunit